MHQHKKNPVMAVWLGDCSLEVEILPPGTKVQIESEVAVEEKYKKKSEEELCESPLLEKK
jgi:hypothetical protein